MQRLRAKAEEDCRRKEAQDAEEAERKRKELVVLAEQAADERRRCMEQQIEATRRRAEKEAAEAEAERLREEAEAERLRDYDAKRRRAAAEADEAAQTSQREAKAALEAERLRAKLEKEHLRFVRDAEDEQARAGREDKSSALLKQSLDLMAKSAKETEKANQLLAKAKARLDRKVAREKLDAENPRRGMSEVDIDTSDDEDFEATVRLSGEVQKLEATGWIEQIRSMWLHQLC